MQINFALPEGKPYKYDLLLMLLVPFNGSLNTLATGGEGPPILGGDPIPLSPLLRRNEVYKHDDPE